MQHTDNYIIIIDNDNEYLLRGNDELKLHYGFDDLKDFDFMTYLPIILPVILVSALLILIALIDLYRHRKTRENVVFWTFIVIFVNTFGPILYFVMGRKDSERS